MCGMPIFPAQFNASPFAMSYDDVDASVTSVHVCCCSSDGDDSSMSLNVSSPMRALALVPFAGIP